MNIPRAIVTLRDDGMENAAIAMEEGELSVQALRILGATQADCDAAFADGTVTASEAGQIADRLERLRRSIERQLAYDCKDLELARQMNGRIGALCK